MRAAAIIRDTKRSGPVRREGGPLFPCRWTSCAEIYTHHPSLFKTKFNKLAEPVAVNLQDRGRNLFVSVQITIHNSELSDDCFRRYLWTGACVGICCSPPGLPGRSQVDRRYSQRHLGCFWERGALRHFSAIKRGSVLVWWGYQSTDNEEVQVSEVFHDSTKSRMTSGCSREKLMYRPVITCFSRKIR